MKYSVVIPVWNQQEFLPDTLDSLKDQTFTDFEVIVVDDGSPDNSGKIADSYSFPRYRVIHQVNKGLASARNSGIMAASGDYVLPLDSDDCLLPTCLEEIAHAIEKTGADIIAPSFKNFGVLNNEVILFPEPTLALLRTQGNLLPYFSAIRREALLECGGYSPRMALGYEDFHLWFDLLSRGKTVHVIQKVLALYRTKEDSMLTKAVKHHTELMTQIAKDFPSVFV